MGQKEKWNSLITMKRDGSGDSVMERNSHGSSLESHLRLWWFQLMLPLKAMSRSVTIQQQGCVKMSMAHITTKNPVNVPGLDCCLELC